MAVKEIGTMNLDELIVSGKSPLHTRVVSVKGTAALKRGQLIGYTGEAGSATYGAYTESSTGVFGILCEDMTPTSEGVKAMVYVSGHFNGNKVVGYTDALDMECRKLGIFVEKAFNY